MTIIKAIRRILGRSDARDANPSVDMSELTARLADSRGDNVSMNSGGGHDTTLADIDEIYEILKPRITPGT